MATTTRTPPLNPRLRVLPLTPKTIEAGKYSGKHTFFGANTMFFSSIPEVICKSEKYFP